MRITLTLDKGVAARLEEVAERRQLPFRIVVNNALRAGLSTIEQPSTSAPFRTAGFDLGPSLVGSLDDVHDVLARTRLAKPPDLLIS